MTEIDTESIREAYDDVRSDNTDINWCICTYEGNRIVLESKGIDYEDFKAKFTADERVYGLVRVFTGDEMSKRAKFALVYWAGPDVSPLKRARMSTDKSLVKNVMQSVAVEIQAAEPEDLEEEVVKEELIKAGGANYGTGSR